MLVGWEPKFEMNHEQSWVELRRQYHPNDELSGQIDEKKKNMDLLFDEKRQALLP